MQSMQTMMEQQTGRLCSGNEKGGQKKRCYPDENKFRDTSILFASALTFASAIITSGVNSTAKASRIALLIRSAWSSDQNLKSSGSRTVSSSRAEVSIGELSSAGTSEWPWRIVSFESDPARAIGLQETGISEGSESRARVTMRDSDERTEVKSRLEGLSTKRTRDSS